MKTRLVIYDFDGTIFRSLEQEAGKKLYLEKTGHVFPCQGWWGRMESLTPPLVPEKPDKSWYHHHIVKQIKLDQACPSTKIVLLTGRPYQLRNRIMEILDCQSLFFDGYYFSGRPEVSGLSTIEMKQKYIKKLLEEKYKTVEIYEDRIDQVVNFVKFGMEMRKLDPSIEKILIHDAVNTNTHEL